LNTALRHAMADKGLSVRRLAARVGVTPKTVERWLADATLVPHARNRVDVSEALEVAEAMLWPNVVKAAVKTGPDREVVAIYPHRSACPSSVWGQLIAEARTDLVFAGYTNYFLWLEQPAFLTTLRRKAESGCRIRFLLGDPDAEITRQREAVEDVALTVSTRIRISLENLAKLADVAGIETRYTHPLDATNHVSLSVFRFDAHALVTPHLARAVGHDSPMMHLRRLQGDGAFDRFAGHAEELWERGRPVAGP
jgi:transcriptional regulator with XRE-family HTH domain